MTRLNEVRRALLVGGAILMLGACGGGGGIGSSSGYSANLGAFEPDKVAADARDYLRRLGYDVEVDNGPPAILIQTFWRSQLPTESEAAAGVSEGRTRIRILGRQRLGMTEATELFVVTFAVEHQVRMGPGGAWQEMPAASEFLEWARTSGRELRLQLESGRRE